MPNESGKKSAIRTKKHIARLERERQQSRIILYVFIATLAAVVLLLIYGYLDIKYFQLQRPVAKVGNTNILAGQFEARVRLQRQQLLVQYSQYSQYAQFGLDVKTQLQQIQSSLDATETIGQNVLDQMINEELVRQEAAKRGIKVDPAELKRMMQDAFGYFPNGSPTPSITPTQFLSPEPPASAFDIVTITPIPSATSEFTATPEFTATVTADLTTGTPQETATLEASSTPTVTPTATIAATFTPSPTATPYTLAGYQKQYATASSRLAKLGFGGNVYQSVFENQILERELKAEIIANVPHTEPQVWARHILVKDEASAVVIIERLKNGEDFATLAVGLSQDTGSAVHGGDLGWFGSGQMVPEFEAAAFALKNPGDYTLTPVKSQFGYHIIQLIAKQDRPLSPDQYTAAQTKAFTDWLASARKEYGVVTYDLWKQHVPTEPNFVTIATDSAAQQLTAQAEANKATATPTVIP